MPPFSFKQLPNLLHRWIACISLATTMGVQARVITLDEAYDRALETDQSIAVAHAEAAKARLDPELALTRLTPRLSSYLTQDRNGRIGNQSTGTNSNEISDDRTSQRVGIALRQPILDFTVVPAYKAGKISTKAADITYAGTVRDTLLAVATAYFDVLTQQKLVSINQDSLRLAKEQRDLATARKNVGEVLQTDVLKSEVAVQRSQRTLVESENLLKFRRSVLANILNLDIESNIQVTEPPSYPFTDETLTSAIMRGKRLREDIQAANLLIEKQGFGREEIRAQYLPSLNADAGVSRDYSNSGGQSDEENNWQFGFSFNIPLFTGGEKKLNLRRSDLEIAQAKLNSQQIEKAVAENIEAAWLEVRALRQNLAGLKVEVAAAEENHRLLQSQYKAGEVKNLDVVQALTDLNISRTDLAVQTYQYQLALRDLARRTAEFENERVQRAMQRTRS